MELVTNPVSRKRSVADSLGIPPARVLLIIETEESPGFAVGEYWRSTVPGASWKMMAHALYENNEQKAMKEVEKYVMMNVNRG